MTEAANPAPQAPGRFHNHSLAGLHEILCGLATICANANAEAFEVQAEIERRCVPLAQRAFDDADKVSGQMTIDTAEAGFRVEAKIGKTVAWDSGKLQAIGEGLLTSGKLNWTAFTKLFTVTFKVPEKVYGSLLDEDLRKQLDTARTVKYDEAPRVRLVKEDA